MKKYKVQLYSEVNTMEWNSFVEHSKNGVFLFGRDFMDYHKDRFNDYSMIIKEGDKWLAVLPANRDEDVVYSHQGLTYGGMIYDKKQKLSSIIEMFQSVLMFLNENGVTTIYLKQLPSIYNSHPSEEMLYALFLAKANLYRRDALAVIDLSKRVTISDIRKRGIKKGVQNQLSVQEKMSFESFWQEILEPNLLTKYNKRPVHSVSEISLLKSHFPMNIRQFNVYHHQDLVAGATIFVYDKVVHVQYVASKNGKSDLGNLDYLFHHLMVNIFPNKKYFDFGCSNEKEGRKLNIGLSYWKESFGAGILAQDFYEIPTANYRCLGNYAL